MEDRVEHSNGVEIPKKSRSLDLKTVYESSVSKETSNNNLKRKKKRKRDHSLENGEVEKNQNNKSKKKVVSLSSIKKDNSSRNDLEEVNNESLILHDLEDPKLDICQKVSDHNYVTGGTIGFGARLIPVPKRKRGFVGRSRYGSKEALKSVGQSSRTVAGRDSEVQNQLLKEEDIHAGQLVVNDNDFSPKTLKKSRKRKPGASVESSVKVSSIGLNSDDPENLAFNAAKMLISLTSEVSVSPSESAAADAADLIYDSVADAADRVLRPRKHHKDKENSRKRRHFYEILSADVEPNWMLNRRIKVFWPLDEDWYYGLVNDYDDEKKLHHIKYDDRDEEWIPLHNERFKILLFASEVPSKPDHRRSPAEDFSQKTDEKLEPSSKNDAMKLTIEDDSSTGSHMDSEPIISWLPKAAHRVKSSAFRATKKQKTLPVLDSVVPTALHDVSTLRDSLEKAQIKSTAGSSSQGKLAAGGRNKCRAAVRITSNKKCEFPLVYSRRRAKRNVKALSHTVWHMAESSIDNSTLSKIVKFYLPVRSVLNHSIGAEKIWVYRASSLFHSGADGAMMAVWPMVRLEMLFVDSVVGLRYFFLESTLKEAIELVYVVLKLFHESDDQHAFLADLPTTSVRFKLSCMQDLRKQLIYTFYNFSKVRKSRWIHLDSKLKKHCLITRQLPVVECTYDNIKALQNGTNQLLDSSSMKGIPKRSTHVLSLMGVTKESPFLNVSPSSFILDMKKSTFSLSFAAAPTFFLNSHLKLLMAHSMTCINFPVGHDSVEHQENSCGLVVNECSRMKGSPSEKSKPDSGGDSFNLGETNQIGSSKKDNDLRIAGNTTSVQDPDMVTPLRQWMKNPSVSRAKSNDIGSLPIVDELSVEIPQFDKSDDGESRCTQISVDLTCNTNGGIIRSPNPTAPRSTWHRNRSGSLLGHLSHGWSDGKTGFLHSKFGNGPKKPRTQVSYSLPLESLDYDDSRYTAQHPKSLSHRRIRTKRVNYKKSGDASSSPRKNMESVSCDANVLVTFGDKGWRECKAQIVLQLFEHNEWKLAVKISGKIRYSYKAIQFQQPGSTNRYTHAMIWKGDKDWSLEFCDRSQWALFKEMHQECYNRNIHAASVKNIPIPGVCLIEENDDNGAEFAFLRSCQYLQQMENDVEMALNPSHVLYDMDSDDEKWISKVLECKVTDEMFEKLMDVFEKAAFVQKRDYFSSAEIEELVAGVEPADLIRRVYDHWRLKRQKMKMPLIRHLQAPQWERYQQQLKEWELSMTSPGGCQKKVAAALEKPPMFAFCLKPRGLEVPNKGLKQRTHKKLSVCGKNNAAVVDTHVFGRRVNQIGIGSADEDCLYHQGLTRSAGTGYFSMKKVHRHKPQRSSKANKKNRVQQRNVSSEWPRQHLDYNGSQTQNHKILDDFEFQSHVANRAARYAKNAANCKRENAQRLHVKADIAVQRATSVLLSADAITHSELGDGPPF